MVWKIRPEILLCPNIPKPLHGQAPRVILGTSWWNKTRQAAYKSTNFRCQACGVHKTKAKSRQWMEGHELYATDYIAGILTYLETVPLCHFCHNFIHDGRLQWLLSIDKISHQKFTAIIQHGTEVLHQAGLRRLDPLERIADVNKQLLVAHRSAPKWSDWHLVLDDKRHYSLFKNEQEWEKAHK